jgi:hypothetical protein
VGLEQDRGEWALIKLRRDFALMRVGGARDDPFWWHKRQRSVYRALEHQSGAAGGRIE